jgi:hypothetical protein
VRLCIILFLKLILQLYIVWSLTISHHIDFYKCTLYWFLQVYIILIFTSVHCIDFYKCTLYWFLQVYFCFLLSYKCSFYWIRSTCHRILISSGFIYYYNYGPAYEFIDLKPLTGAVTFVLKTVRIMFFHQSLNWSVLVQVSSN